MKLQAPKVLQHLKPSGTKGVVQTSIVYIGLDKVLSFVDGLEGGMVQKIGVPVPIIGRLSLLDAIEYMIIAGGAKFNVDTLIAFAATKFFNAGTNLAAPFLPKQVSSGSGSTQISPAIVTVGGGAPIG